MKTLKINEKLESLLHELEFKDAKELMKDSLITEILYRISVFSEEIRRFENKYSKSFKEFKNEYELGEEDYSKYDDLMAWEFAKEGKDYLDKKLEELKSVL